MVANKYTWKSMGLSIAILTALAILIGYVSVGGMLIASVVAAGIISFFGMIAIGYDYRLGIYATMLFGVFMFYINRILPTPIPLGILYESILGFSFLIVIFTPKDRRVDWKELMNPVTVFFIIILTYSLVQLFNPNSTSFGAGIVFLRSNITLLIYVLCFHYFRKIEDVKTFTIVWLGLWLLIAVYGIYQEVFGLTDFEWRWIYETPERYQLYFIWGHMRKFSFLSDASAFGLTMAFGVITCFILALGPFSWMKRGLCIFSGLIMAVSMGYSGTRTSYAMVAVAAFFYILLTIRSRKTVIAMLGFGFVAMMILFGPIHGGTISRIRSTFNPSDDPSMNVRDVKRLRYQDYVQSHPIGSGPNTVGLAGLRYSPGHPLSGNFDTDSGYLTIAVETGWIGLILMLSLFGYVGIKGINEYNRVEDPVYKTMILAYIVPYFALSIAEFAQDAMFQRTLGVVIFATYALIQRVQFFERNKT